MLLILLSSEHEFSPGAVTTSARAVADGHQNMGPVETMRGSF